MLRLLWRTHSVTRPVDDLFTVVREPAGGLLGGRLLWRETLRIPGVLTAVSTPGIACAFRCVLFWA